MKGVSTCVLCGVGVIIMEGRNNLVSLQVLSA